MGIASQENLKTRGVWGLALWKIFSTEDPNLCYTKVICMEVMITDIMKLCANAFLLHLLTTFNSTSTLTHSHLSKQLLSSNCSPWLTTSYRHRDFLNTFALFFVKIWHKHVGVTAFSAGACPPE